MVKARRNDHPKLPIIQDNIGQSSQELLRSSRSNEIFIAIVAPAGSGAGTSAKILRAYLELQKIGADNYKVEIIKASDCIKDWAVKNNRPLPPEGRKSISSLETMQDRGDDLRHEMKDNAAVARAIIKKIMEVRAKEAGRKYKSGEPIAPDGRPRAYIIDSLRHPAEVRLLRELYQEAFFLVGIVCDTKKREKRLRNNLFDRALQGAPATRNAIKTFMDRDADAPEKHGQHVTDTFHQADYFVDNSKEGNEDLTHTGMNDSLLRFVKMVTSSDIVRPSIAETAMHQAYSAQLRSACMSRQVGAALIDKDGNTIATGTNEVPKAGGGVYGEGFEQIKHESRCVFREHKFCSSNREQNEIINELINQFPELTASRSHDDALKLIRGTKIGGLIEFSRAVHAEMDAILSASRSGVSPVGCRLFVTTFPCHYCARHIVSAGVSEVQYIEPYPKSKALGLHCDSITTEQDLQKINDERSIHLDMIEEDHSKKVLFKPFEGVAPRMYARVFLKERDYKDKITGEFMIGKSDWRNPADAFAVPYTKIEADLARVI